MTLQTHVDTILKWICSATDEQHLDLLNEVVNEFVAKRFEHLGLHCQLAVEDLKKAMEEQQIIIKRLDF